MILTRKSIWLFSWLLILLAIMTPLCKAELIDSLTIDGEEIRQQIFPETPLASDKAFKFDYPFDELSMYTADDIALNALLFHSSSKPKGVILYLHGSNGAADVWGKIAPIYTALSYDFCLLDYRGYGKSEGRVLSEEQLFQDVQMTYDTLKARYGEERLIVIGQSIGTGAAAYLGAQNQPKMLMLQAPYYSIDDWIHQMVPNIQIVNNPFKFETYKC